MRLFVRTAIAIVTAIAPISTSVASATEVKSPTTGLIKKCHVFIQGYAHITTWYDENSKIRIKAQSACASRWGRPLDLKNVSLSIIKNGQVIAQLDSPTGTVDQRQRRFLLGQSFGPVENTPITNLNALVIDMKTGTIRSDGLYFELLSSRTQRSRL